MIENYCAIDIGSNAMRAVVARYHNNELSCFKNYRFPLRLGADVFKQGKISPARLKKTEIAFGELFLKLSKHHVTKVRACATSALRDSMNGEQLIQSIRTQTGIDIEIIDGITEAQLIKEAISSRYNLKKKVALMIDIGGGSTEITLTDNSQIIASRSYQFGTVRLLESHKNKSIFNDIQVFCEDASSFISEHTHSIDTCIGTGGNLRRMGKLRSMLLEKASASITINELDAIYQVVNSYPLSKRVKLFNMRKDRADVIIPAMMMINHLMRYCEINTIHLPRVGLKEGILLSIPQRKVSKLHLAIKDQ